MKKFFSHILRLVILLAILIAALPTPAQAAEAPQQAGWKGKCACFFQVEKRDTLPKIARMFGISAQEIADANFITTSTKLKVGQVLCIPRVAFPKVYPKASFSGSVAFNRVFIEGSNFPAKERFIVRMRVRNQGAWVVIGALTTDKNGVIKNNFRIPKNFYKERRFEICLKLNTSGDTVCTQVKRVGENIKWFDLCE
jgi:LysM repeat protein